MRELHRSPYFVITVDDEHRLLRRTRTDVPFTSIAEINLAYDTMIRVSESVGHEHLVMLTDARLAPPRNDPAFEEVVQRYMPRIVRGFRKTAVLVKTEAGRLQITRLLRENALSGRVFLDEVKAIAYLLEPEGRRGPP